MTHSCKEGAKGNPYCKIGVLQAEIEGLKRDAARLREEVRLHINAYGECTHAALDNALSQTPDSAAWLEGKIRERAGPLRELLRLFRRVCDTMPKKPTLGDWDGPGLMIRIDKVLLSTEDNKEKRS